LWKGGGVVDREKSYCIDASYFKGTNLKQYLTKSRRQIVFTFIPESKADFILKLASLKHEIRKAVVKKSIELPENIQIKVLPNQFIYTNHLGQNGTLYKDKCATLVTACSAHVVTEDFKIRKLTPVECERLQTLSDNYTAGISDTQRYKCLGNGWTVDVIAHIFRNIT
jgi:site-specific DNA-cytosine methylase